MLLPISLLHFYISNFLSVCVCVRAWARARVRARAVLIIAVLHSFLKL